VPDRRHFQAPVRKFSFVSRAQAVREVARKLQRHGWPRFEMLLIVSLTGLAGFIASVVLLSTGVEAMWQRYPLAIGIAYLVFLLQLWIWMHVRDVSDGIDLWDGGSGGGTGHAGDLHGGGGDFGGGGASGSWDASDVSAFDAVGDTSANALGSAAEGEGCVIAIVLALAVLLLGSLFVAAIYVVSGAPLLMAELLVDAALSFGLYRNLRRQERGFWLFTALRRTAWLFLLVAVVAGLVGAGLAKYAPGASTLGQAIDVAKSKGKHE
jgi:uncharacterized membrane protein YgcG